MYIYYSVPEKHYRLAMYIFGLMTQTTTMAELEKIVESCAVLFASPKRGENVDKHFNTLQQRLTHMPKIEEASGTHTETEILVC